MLLNDDIVDIDEPEKPDGIFSSTFVIDEFQNYFYIQNIFYQGFNQNQLK